MLTKITDKIWIDLSSIKRIEFLEEEFDFVVVVEWKDSQSDFYSKEKEFRDALTRVLERLQDEIRIKNNFIAGTMLLGNGATGHCT